MCCIVDWFSSWRLLQAAFLAVHACCKCRYLVLCREYMGRQMLDEDTAEVLAGLSQVAGSDAGLPPESRPLPLGLIHRCRIGVDRSLEQCKAAAAPAEALCDANAFTSVWMAPLLAAVQALVASGILKELPPAADTVAACSAAAHTLLAHEAALERFVPGIGPETSSHTIVLLSLGPTEAGAQRRFLRDFSGRLMEAASLLPAAGSGSIPSKAAMGAASRLGFFANAITLVCASDSFRYLADPTSPVWQE